MKRPSFALAITCAILIPRLAAAIDAEPPTILPGEYVPSAEILPTGLIRKETLNSSTQEGRSRRERLLADGYECRRGPQSVELCRKTLAPAEFPRAIGERIVAQESRAGSVLLGPQRASASPIFLGEASKEWSVPQELRYDGQVLSLIRVIQIAASSSGPEVTKLKGGEPFFEFVLLQGDRARLGRHVKGVERNGAVTDEYLGLYVRELK